MFKNKKKLIVIVLIIVIIFISEIILIKNIKNKKNKKIEMQPEEEISEQQYRQTMVLLYFINSDTGKIETETRLVDIKILINNPYETIIKMLIEGGKKKNLVSYIPEETKIEKIELNNNLLIINFSKEFSKINDLENKEKIINIIESTLKELIEINNVEIISK